MAITLDERLEKDTVAIGDLAFCQVRLMQDARWPWLILIPQKIDLVELHDLTPAELALVMADIAKCSSALKTVTGCTKINAGALGNIVRQLHIHVIARSEGDSNWPNPVWGFERGVAYNESAREKLIHQISEALF